MKEIISMQCQLFRILYLQRAGQEGPRRKYLDFIDILLEAKVRVQLLG